MDEIVASENLPQSTGREPYLNEKRRITFIYIPLVLVASMLADIVLGSGTQYGPIVSFVTAIGVNVLIFAWSKADAGERNYELSKHFPLMFVLFGIFTLIYYLLRSRGPRSGLVSIGWMLLYVVGLVVVFMFFIIFFAFLLVITGKVGKGSLTHD